jgi:hypothetical protein
LQAEQGAATPLDQISPFSNTGSTPWEALTTLLIGVVLALIGYRHCRPDNIDEMTIEQRNHSFKRDFDDTAFLLQLP